MSLKAKIIGAYTETRRILRLTRKPKRSEYNETAKITGIGIVLIGLVGFIIFLLSTIFR